MGEDDSAFGGGRSPRWVIFIVGLDQSHEGLAAERLWVRSFWDDDPANVFHVNANIRLAT